MHQAKFALVVGLYSLAITNLSTNPTLRRTTSLESLTALSSLSQNTMH